MIDVYFRILGKFYFLDSPSQMDGFLAPHLLCGARIYQQRTNLEGLSYFRIMQKTPNDPSDVGISPPTKTKISGKIVNISL